MKLSVDNKVVKRSVTIAGHRTSISLENAFWVVLQENAQQRQITMAALIAEIDRDRGTNLSSALRLYALTCALRKSAP